MKPSWEWTEDDLLSMKANQIQESLHLEFKGSQSLDRNDNKKRNELSKDVSSFANSDGGDIVYGVSEDGKPPSKFGDIDEGINPSNITPEWVEQVLNSNIHPRITALRISPIELKTTRLGRYAYVVNIPKSYNAPHQASDKKYYKRFNFMSVAMEDYEIRELRTRREKAELSVYCEISNLRYSTLSKPVTWPSYFLGLVRPGPIRIPSFNMRVAILNSGARAAKNAQAILSFDNLRIRNIKGIVMRIDELREGRPSLQWASLEDIIHAGTIVRIMDLSLDVLKLKEFCTIKTEAYAEDIPRVTHEYNFHNSWLFVVDFTDSSGNKRKVTLDMLEKMNTD